MLIFVYVGYVSVQQSWGAAGTIWALFFVLALFTCVVLHEFGHALTARQYGVRTRDIILSPIGGVARLDRLPEKPFQEFMVAIAGPLVNLLIALLLSPYLLRFEWTTSRNFFLSLFNEGGNYFMPDLAPFEYFFLGIIALNLTLAAFNLIPAFPMDGGRILRALLASRTSRLNATRIAAYVGQGAAIVLITLGLFQGDSLIFIFIGIFVFITASGEYRMVRTEEMLARYGVTEVVRRSFIRIYKDDPMEEALRSYQTGSEKHFLVLDQWQSPAGVLQESQIMNAFRAKDFDSLVKDYYTPMSDLSFILEDDNLKQALNRIQEHEIQLLPVLNKWGDLVGVLDFKQLTVFLKLISQKNVKL